MKLISWNVNGIRSIVNKGFVSWLSANDAMILGIQEARASVEQIPQELLRLPSWFVHVVAAERKGYSGVGLLSKIKPDHMETSMGMLDFDNEGRLQIATFGALRVANVYFPNGSGKERDNSRVPYKLAFYQRLFELLDDDFQAGRPLLVMGDFNTAHREIDLARPQQNTKTSGFLPEERAELHRWIEAGWVDTFRYYYPEKADCYTWWRQWGGMRENNVGWRIDLILASPGAMPFLQKAHIWPEILGSDHCPIGVDVDNSILWADWDSGF